MQLGERSGAGHGAHQQIQFPFEGIEVGQHRLGTGGGGDPVATAEPAGFPAEGQVHIQRQVRWVGFGQFRQQVAALYPRVEGLGGGVTGVAGHWAVVTQQQL